MKLLPIQQTRLDNAHFIGNPDCEPGLSMTIDFFNRVGYVPPWIGYFVELDGKLVGSAAFKGQPKAGRVEIAYGTFPAYQNRGVGTEVCKQLVRLALQADPLVTVTARTLPEESYSTHILRKNKFICLGTVWDEEDGDVWEWAYQSRA
ncbi:GNAT family N-acetyltransferase [Spirosoma soli]|uniref:GNAT family N-acetyltransferase n=1 Tax=Spirosoma soli TaxID=1770529 RepID=A0ABW5M5M2_9BACT